MLFRSWRHLVASCAVPLLMRPVRIDGNWYLDGGLLHALPLAAALALDATEILALNVLAEFPEPALQPLVLAFRTVMSKAVVIPANVKVATLVPRKRLGNLKGASIWNAANVEKWYAQGIEDASSAFDGGQLAFLQNISTGDCLGP